MDMNVNFYDMKSCHRLDRPFDAALNVRCDIRNTVAEFHNDRYVYSSFALSNLDLNALR
ncbi:hypothetical protein D3C84_1068490 [compost metagenome]